MIKEGKVRPEGCICEQCSDILRYTPFRLTDVKKDELQQVY